MNSNGLKVEIRPAPRPGPVKAYADVLIPVHAGELLIHGFSVIQKDGKPIFVGFPSKQGSIQGKYFPIIEAEGEIKEAICKAILEAYQKAISELGARQ